MKRLAQLSTRVRLIGIVPLSIVAATMLLAPAAGAATTCEYDGSAEVLNVKMSANGDSALLKVSSGDIQVRGGGPVLNCGTTPTLANTEFVNVFDESGNGSTTVSILQPADFAGLGINLVMGDGEFDRLLLSLGAVPGHLVIGQNGIDSDGDGNRDLNFVGSIPEELEVSGGEAPDLIGAHGSTATGAPLNGPFVALRGFGGDDTLEGSEAGDLLEGEGGSDTLRGFGGDDGLAGDALAGGGDDVIDGGAGSDSLRFPLSANGVTVDLGQSGPQATGQGTDTISSVENVSGTEFDDVLAGAEGPNTILGGPGDDLLDGRGGDDYLDGGGGADTVAYATAPAGIAVDLEAETASGGAGSDTVKGIENVIGTPFADALAGSAADNLIEPLAGPDVVEARGGADTVLARDGEADNASCGAGNDKAVADRLSLDTIQADCENVEALPEPAVTPTGGGGAGGGGGGDGGGGASTSGARLTFTVRAAHGQDVLAHHAVLLKARCVAEPCKLLVKGSAKLAGPRHTHGHLRRIRLTPVRKRLPAGRTQLLRVPLTARQLKALRNNLHAHPKPKLELAAIASDATGHHQRRTITVVAQHKKHHHAKSS